MTRWRTADQDAWNRELAARFFGHFPKSAPRLRTIGREAEYPVVRPDGQAGDVPELLEQLAGLPGYEAVRADDMLVAVRAKSHTFSTEVGLGTIELISEPCTDLSELKDLHESAMETLFGVCAEQGQVVLGLGMQPFSGAALTGMTPKPRYQILLETIGPGWLWFTLTASDQLHVDISRDELLPYTNLGNALSAVTIALCANSSLRENRPLDFCSGREAGMGQIGAADGRHGIPGAPFDSESSFIAQATRQQLVMQKKAGVAFAYDGTFLDYLAERGDLDAEGRWEAFLLHEHYIWHSARPRSAQTTLELRSACQQPWPEHLAAAALNLGMVQAAPRLIEFVESSFGAESWRILHRYHGDVVRQGLGASEPTDGFLQGVLDRCAEALEARGRGEAQYLTPLYARLARRENPAQHVLRCWKEGGLTSVLRAFRAGGARVG